MKKGLTLIELLITITLLSILLISFSSIYISGIKTYREEFAKSQLQTEAQTILDKISTDIKASKTTEAQFTDSSTGLSYTLNSNTLILLLPAIDNRDSNGQNIIYSGNSMLFDRVIYQKNGNSLTKKVISAPGSARLNENNITKTLSPNNIAFTFTPVTANANQINLTLTFSKKVGNKTLTTTVRGTANFRNF